MALSKYLLLALQIHMQQNGAFSTAVLFPSKQCRNFYSVVIPIFL